MAKKTIEKIVKHIELLQEDMRELSERGYRTVWISVRREKGDTEVFIDNGLLELAKELKRTVEEEQYLTPNRKMTYEGVKFTQYPEKQAPKYKGREE